jgi:hypothetical protein
MWLLLAITALACDPPAREMRLVVVDDQGAAVRGALVRLSAREGAAAASLGVTDDSGVLTTCIAGSGLRGSVRRTGYRPRKLTFRPGSLEVRLEPADTVPLAGIARPGECVTGSTRDGYRLCAAEMSRLPLRY